MVGVRETSWKSFSDVGKWNHYLFSRFILRNKRLNIAQAFRTNQVMFMEVRFYQLLPCHKWGVFGDWVPSLRALSIYSQEGDALKRSRFPDIFSECAENLSSSTPQPRKEYTSELLQEALVWRQITVANAMRDASDLEGFASLEEVTNQKTSCLFTDWKRRKYQVYSLIKRPVRTHKLIHMKRKTWNANPFFVYITFLCSFLHSQLQLLVEMQHIPCLRPDSKRAGVCKHHWFTESLRLQSIIFWVWTSGSRHNKR